MRLNAAEQESFQKCLKIFCGKNPNIKNCEIINHIVKEGIARSTICVNLKRLETGQSFSDKKRSGCQHPGLEKRKPN